jgi:hypothetical protein
MPITDRVKSPGQGPVKVRPTPSRIQTGTTALGPQTEMVKPITKTAGQAKRSLDHRPTEARLPGQRRKIAPFRFIRSEQKKEKAERKTYITQEGMRKNGKGHTATGGITTKIALHLDSFTRVEKISVVTTMAIDPNVSIATLTPNRTDLISLGYGGQCG